LFYLLGAAMLLFITGIWFSNLGVMMVYF